MNNALTLINTLMALAAQAVPIMTLLQTAQAEGREVTDAEVDALFADDLAARAAFQAHIDAARAAGG